MKKILSLSLSVLLLQSAFCIALAPAESFARAEHSPTDKTVADAVIVSKSSDNNALSVSIPDGTEVKIITIEEISGQKVVEGDPLNFKVAEDVMVNGKIVIAKDILVKGTVSAAKKKGMMGRGGTLSIRIESTTTVDGQKIKLRAAKSGAGGDNMGSTVALTVLFGPLGLLRKGKEAKIKAGTILTAFTDETKVVVPKG